MVIPIVCLILVLVTCSGCGKTDPQITTETPLQNGISDYPNGTSDNFVDMSDEDLVYYLLETNPEAYHYVYVAIDSLNPVVTGGITTLYEGDCRDIWLTTDGTTLTPVIKYTISPEGTVFRYEPVPDDFFVASMEPFIEYPTPLLTEQQAENLLYEKYAGAEFFYPGELSMWEGDDLLYGFTYYDGEIYRYAYVNGMTGEIKIVDEIENYTREY